MNIMLGGLSVAFLFFIASPVWAQGFSFTDDFEQDKGWTYFEEAVNSCSGTNLGSATITTSTFARSAPSVMRVWANEAETSSSSHVIAQKKLMPAGPGGTWTYTLWSWVNPDELRFTQAGPEFSLQNTHPVGLDMSGAAPISMWRTHTAGLQYIGNQWVPQKWYIWSVNNPTGPAPQSETADWLAESTLPTLTETGWHKFVLVVDYDTNKYVSLQIETPSGSSLTYPLSGWDIAREVKFAESAVWATLEAENLYACNPPDVYTYQAFYDDVEVQMQGSSVPEAPTAANSSQALNTGESFIYTLDDLAIDSDLDPSTVTLVIEPAEGSATVDATTGELTYHATVPGGYGLKYAVCDSTFLCDDAWIDISVPNRAPFGDVAYAVVAPGASITIPNPITDPDGNLNINSLSVSVAPAQGTAVPDSGNNAFIYTANPNGSGQQGFHVTACDTWGWCGGTWIVVTVQ